MRSVHQMLVSPELGGAARIGLNLAEHLRDSGQECRIWVPGSGPAQLEAERRRFLVSSYDLEGAMRKSRLHAAWANWKIGLSLTQEGCQVLHIHSPHAYGACEHALRWSRRKTILHIHLQQDPESLRWALQHPPDAVITCARFLQSAVEDCLPANKRRPAVYAVPNAVDTSRFFPGDRRLAKQEVGAPLDRPLILMLANLASHKGQETTVRAVSLLQNRHLDVECWLVGEERGGSSQFTQSLRRLTEELGVSSRVRFLGQRSDAPNLLRAADFLALPSTSEGLPLSVLEAQASRVPVLAAPTAGIPEVVLDGTTGFLIDAEDAEGYATRVERLVANPRQYEKIADQALEMVQRSFTWYSYCRQVVGIYEKTLGSKDPK